MENGERTIDIIGVQLRASGAASLLRRRRAAPPRATPDQLAAFAPLVIAIRWATVAVGLAVGALGTDAPRMIVFGLPLVGYASLRTLRPLRYPSENLVSLLMVIAEVALSLGVVVGTGYWDSPYVFTVAAAIVAAGFARGFGFAIRTALTAVAGIALPYHLDVADSRLVETAQWAGEMLLIAVVAGYARRLFGEAEERNALARQANDLLAQLNAVARNLPASLDLDESVGVMAADLHDTVPVDALAVLLADEEATSWTTVRAEGLRLPPLMATVDLPPPLGQVVATRNSVATQRDGPRLAERTAAGLYLPLVARDRVVGVVALESAGPLPGGAAERASSITADAALTIDNARWYARLRAIGASEERGRIARDLHDRLGQSLASLSFELDRISRKATDQPVAADLERLREDVRTVVTEVRETLHDLRADVSGEQDIVATLHDFVRRVEDRTDAHIVFDHAAAGRLPIRQEREMWRIAQEAVGNAVRHSGASRIDVSWQCDGRSAELVVKDDGVGIGQEAGRDSFGLVGMRERAEVLGAELTFESEPGQGTLIRCRLET